MSSRPTPDPTPQRPAHDDVIAWLEQHGDAVYAYANARVENESIAEELVQDTFLAALKNYERFQGKSTPKTWLIAILRNKIIEHYRRRTRRRQPIDEATSTTFDEKGIWKIQVGPWPKKPDEIYEDREFWQTFDDCLRKLPSPIAEVFMLRVLDGLDAENVCKTLKITASNMAVRLHRARLALRNCLGKNWFGDD